MLSLQHHHYREANFTLDLSNAYHKEQEDLVKTRNVGNHIVLYTEE